MKQNVTSLAQNNLRVVECETVDNDNKQFQWNDLNECKNWTTNALAQIHIYDILTVGNTFWLFEQHKNVLSLESILCPILFLIKILLNLCDLAVAVAAADKFKAYEW